MSLIDNEIHLVLVTCYNILNGAALRIDTEMHALSWFIKSPMTRWQSIKVTDFHHPWDTPETCTLDHIRSHYVEHNRERLHFPSNHCWLEPPTSDSSVEWLSRVVIQDCHYHISSLNSLPALYIFLSLFSYCMFFSFLLPFSHAIQWHNLQTVEVGNYLVEVEVEVISGQIKPKGPILKNILFFILNPIIYLFSVVQNSYQHIFKSDLNGLKFNIGLRENE